MNQAVNVCLAGWNHIGKAFCGSAASVFVQSALLVIVLFTLDLLLRRRVRAVFRYCVWLLVLVKLILPPTLSLPTGIGYWIGDRWPTALAVSEPVSMPTEHKRVATQRYAAPEPSGGIPQTQPPAHAAETVVSAPPATWNWTPVTWQGIVLLLWLAGLLAFLILLAQRLRFVRGLVAASTPAGGDLLDLQEQCRRQIGVRRPVGLRTLDTLPSPAVCGLWQPVILMPTTLMRKLSPEGLRAALLHELAHIKRADLWINVAQTFLQVVYFYNPFVWLANAMIRRTCEEAVDETVLVALGGQAKNYSNTLIDISEMAFWKADFGLRLIGVAESRKALQGRIKRMLTRPIPKSARIGVLGASVILVIAAVLLPMARGTERGQRGTSSLMDRVQQEDDTELSDMIRTAVENHKGASEKEILEITRRVTQSRAQILLLDAQIEEINRKLDANPGPGETRDGLLRSKKEVEVKRMAEMASLRESMGIVPRLPFATQPTANLNAWVKLQVLEERVVVHDVLKKFDDEWTALRHKVVGAFSEKETLGYLRGRLKDKGSLPIRIHIYYLPETRRATDDLCRQILALAREANAQMVTEVRLEPSVWVGSGESPFYLREGKIRTFYPPRPMLRPDGGRTPLTSGLVDPNDLEQHILWHLTMPKNLPLTFRIEYDEASSVLAKQVADTAKAVAKRVGLTDLVGVTGVLIEPVPESAFLGKWQALGKGIIRSVDIQPRGVCQVIVGEGAPVLKAGASVTGTWVWTAREIQLDINDPIPGTWEPLHYAYRASVNGEGNLVIARGEIYPQGSFMLTRPPQMIFKKVQ